MRIARLLSQQTLAAPILGVAAAALLVGGFLNAPAPLAPSAAHAQTAPSEAPPSETAPSADAREMTPQEREAFRAEVRAFILEEPEIILEALQILDAKRRDDELRLEREAVAAHAEQLFNDGFSYVGGNPNGSVTVVEFLDYRCGFCKRAHGEVEAFLAADGDVRLIVKEFPVLGPDSRYAGVAALASLRQADGALYKPFHDAMITHRGELDAATVDGFATAVGLDLEQLRRDMADPEIERQIEATYALAGALRIDGTPAFIVGDRVVRGAVPSATLAQLTADARARAE